MNFASSSALEDFLATVRRFVEEHLVPIEVDLRRRAPGGHGGLTEAEATRLQTIAAGFGLWGVSTPKEHGGLGLSMLDQTLVRMETARTVVPFTPGGEAPNILFAANPAQLSAYLEPTLQGDRSSCFALTETSAGSDPRAMTTRATRTKTGWEINGEKAFITRGTTADYAIVFARTERVDGENDAVTCFLVDRAAGWTSTAIEVMGGPELGLLRFDHVNVSEGAVLGQVGQGFRLAMRWVGRGRLMVAARAVGIADRLLGMAIDYARSRETFGRSIGDRQAVQWQLADSFVELEAARLLTLQAAWCVDRHDEAPLSTAAAKLAATRMVGEVVDRTMQIHGALGYTTDLPIERWYREVRAMRIYEGTDEVQRMTLARGLLRS